MKFLHRIFIQSQADGLNLIFPMVFVLVAVFCPVSCAQTLPGLSLIAQTGTQLHAQEIEFNKANFDMAKRIGPIENFEIVTIIFTDPKSNEMYSSDEPTLRKSGRVYDARDFESINKVISVLAKVKTLPINQAVFIFNQESIFLKRRDGSELAIFIWEFDGRSLASIDNLTFEIDGSLHREFYALAASCQYVERTAESHISSAQVGRELGDFVWASDNSGKTFFDFFIDSHLESVAHCGRYPIDESFLKAHF